MTNLASQVADISITATTSTQSRPGFGTALIAAADVPWSNGARVRAFSTLASMLALGFLSTSPAYKMAEAAFAQEPAPPRVKIGRRDRVFTQVVNLTPSAPVSAGVAERYEVKVDGLAAVYTSDLTGTVGEVRTGLTAALNALADADALVASGGASSGSPQTIEGTALNGVVGRSTMAPARAVTLTFSSHADWDATTATVTGVDVDGRTVTDTFSIPNGGNATVTGASGTHFARVTSIAIPAQSGTGGTFTAGTRAPVTAAVDGSNVVCTSVVGELHSFELVTSNVALEDVTSDPGLAADLNELLAADGDFYGLLLDSQGAAEVLAASSWAETNRRFFAYQTADSEVGDASVTDDVMSTLKLGARFYTLGFFYPGIALSDGWLAAAALGQHLPTDPGSATLAFKTLRGITRRAISDSFVAAIVTTPDSVGKNGNIYTDFGGQSATFPGMMAAGEWADVVRGLDWARATMRARFLAVQLANAKVAFTDNGVDLFRAEVIATLKAGIASKLFAETPKYTVVATPVADTSVLDRSARRFNGISFSVPLAGAILYTSASGTATI